MQSSSPPQGLKDRVDYLEQIVGDSADKHAQAFDAAHAKLEGISGRLAAHEEEATHAHAKLEGISGRLAEHEEEATQAHAKLARIHERLATCEDRPRENMVGVNMVLA